MRPNSARRALESGGVALGINVSCASPLAAETLGHLGYDWVMVDLQHGENNLGNLAPMLTAISATPATPWVRVLPGDGPLIQRAFDLGAYGVVTPLVDTAADAAFAVRQMRYPPGGERSWGPIRGALYGGADYYAAATRELQLVVMIETEQAIANVDAIMAVDGVAGCLIGTNDFNLGLGRPPRPTPDTALMDPDVEAAVERVLLACQRHGKAPGIFTSDTGMASYRVRQGFRIISLPGDMQTMKSGAAATLGAVRSTEAEGARRGGR